MGFAVLETSKRFSFSPKLLVSQCQFPLFPLSPPFPPFSAGAPRQPARAPPEQADSQHIGRMRNDPCPCGSGKKFKKCHGSVVPIALQLAGDERRDEFRRAGLAKDADMRLHTDLLRWADRHLPVTWLDEMLEIYLGIEGELSDDDDIPIEEENLWLTWSLYHCPLDNGGTVAEQFRAERVA